MEKAQKAVDSVVDGVKKVAIGEKKTKVKKEKGGDGGADAGMLAASVVPGPQIHEDYTDQSRIIGIEPLPPISRHTYQVI